MAVFVLSDRPRLGKALLPLTAEGNHVTDRRMQEAMFSSGLYMLPSRCQAVCFLFKNCRSLLCILSHNFNIYWCNYSMFTLY